MNSRILLGAIFYLFLTPIALLARLTRGDLLHLKKRAGAEPQLLAARATTPTRRRTSRKLW